MKIRIARTVLDVMLLLGLMGPIAVNAVAFGPGTPDVKEGIVLCDGPGPQPQPDGKSLSQVVRMGTLWLVG